MEASMDRQKQSAQNIDLTPALKMYLDSVESWKQNYEKLVQSSNVAAHAHDPGSAASIYGRDSDRWQKAGEEIFKNFVEEQIEICRFFGKRWERYLDLPEQITHCKTPAEIGQLQLAFLTRMAAEYAQESAKLMQPMNEFIAKWMSGQTLK